MFKLVASVFKLILADPIVLYPAMISSFCALWLIQTISPENKTIFLTTYLITSWLINLFIQLLSADIGLTLLKAKPTNFNKSLTVTCLRFFPALVITGLLSGICGLLLLGGRRLPLLGILSLPVLIFCAMLLQLYPVSYAASRQNALHIYWLVIQTLFSRPRFFGQVFSIVFLCTFCFLFLSLLIRSLPANFNLVLSALNQGYFNVFICYALLLLWQNKPQISIKV
jgi:hypothetical protein